MGEHIYATTATKLYHWDGERSAKVIVRATGEGTYHAMLFIAEESSNPGGVAATYTGALTALREDADLLGYSMGAIRRVWRA